MAHSKPLVLRSQSIFHLYTPSALDLIGGNFNTILHQRDRLGSNTNRHSEMVDFAEVIEDCRLLDREFDGPISPGRKTVSLRD